MNRSIDMMMTDYGYGSVDPFDGVMPKVADIVGTTGDSDVVVKLFDDNYNGADSLKVLDTEKAMEV